MPKLGEIYPLGGAGDRLGLVDPNTGECLPAALLPFCGRTLLEGLIRDLQVQDVDSFNLNKDVMLFTNTILFVLSFYCHFYFIFSKEISLIGFC